MRRILMALAAMGIFYGAGACLAADGDVKLSGTFIRENQKATHPIKAVFTPDGDKKWKVVFTFDWANKGEQVWKGTAEGDLANGEIKGEGTHPNGKRTFTFSGTAKDGKIDCKDNETTSGKPEATGTLTLKKD